MSEHSDGNSYNGSGFSSRVEYEGQCYHVQTQCSTRNAPVIESLVYHSGQVLVRITSSYADVANQLGFTEDDGRHLLELQHADLVRKVRHGMLRGDAATAAEEPRLLDTEGQVVDPAEIDDPSVQQLLRDLGVAIDKTPAPPVTAERRGPATHSRPAAVARRRWPRLVIRIILPF